ncbi:hypothetical protein [Neobacillus cucumis]|uniref:hypothetical protein n=1 Tax=Neobacillus cucumis TaxID=1740721 RepID=UPI0015E0BEA9|nr:hypothetical protein [Neobacillus cucumis]
MLGREVSCGGLEGKTRNRRLKLNHVVGWRKRITLQKKGTSNTTIIAVSYEDWVRGKVQ